MFSKKKEEMTIAHLNERLFTVDSYPMSSYSAENMFSSVLSYGMEMNRKLRIYQIYIFYTFLSYL